MIDDSGPGRSRNNGCLTDGDLYDYISGQGRAGKHSPLEAHLAACSSCRQNLAGLLKILDPDAERDMKEIQEPSGEEIGQIMALIQNGTGKEHAIKKRFSLGLQRPLAAAAAIAFIALSIVFYYRHDETKRSEGYYSQAKKVLEHSYSGTSPGNLRLALPFNALARTRDVTRGETLRKAENLFYQALAVRQGMVEARLGLAYIYLSESKPDLARNEFQKVLDKQQGHIQALLGLGVAKYEQAMHCSDPLERHSLLSDALSNFNAVLQTDPNSMEARYDKAWALFDSGMHEDALREIEGYLSLDPNSGWAEALRGLKLRIKATKSSALEEEVLKAARARNRDFLWELARYVPHHLPGIIVSTIRQSQGLDAAQSVPARASSKDLRWAAETMEEAYSSLNGDHGLKACLVFYIGLSPPQRALEKALDKKLEKLARLYVSGKSAETLKLSKQIESQYAGLKDFWQLAGVHHLRGNCFYFGMADFDSAEAEFLKMLEIARRSHAFDLMANAMTSLATIYGMQRKFDDSLHYANELKILAQTHQMERWQMYACTTLGNQFRRIGQFEQGLREYAAGLQIAYRLLDSRVIVETLEHLGETMDGLGRMRDANACYQQARLELERYYKTGANRTNPETRIRQLNLLSKQGDIALRQGDLPSAETYLRESIKLGSPGMVELEGRNRLGLAGIYLRTNRVAEAEDMLKSVRAISASGRYPDIEWRVKSMSGSLLEQKGRHQEALVSLQQSIAVLENMRQNITTDDLRRSFLNDRYDPYKTMIALLLDSGGDRREAIEFVDRSKSLTLKEHLQLKDLAANATVTSSAARKLPYRIVEYVFGHNRLFIIYTYQEQIRTVSRPISREVLAGNIRAYLESIRDNDLKAFAKMARLLYSELIAPIEEPALADASEDLVILPDGPLHLLPFAGLQDRDGHFLIEKIPLAFAPSRSVFLHCISANDRGKAQKRTVLIDGSSGLPSAREELDYLSKLYGKNAVTLMPEDLPKFSQEVANSDILHFSGHADIVQNMPVLLLKTSPREMYLDCQTIGRWRMPNVRLVDLSGCSTAIGPLSEGEAPWGLIPAFLNAGAPAIIASLMPVDDFSTKQLNIRFYDLLRKGVGKAKALRQAQLALLDSARCNSNAAPLTWLTYILVGNPR